MKFPTIIFSFLIFFLVLNSAFSFGKKDKSESESQNLETQKTETKKDFLTIDLILDTNGAHKNTHFNWKNSSAKYKDSFDAISGASKVHSTKNLREFAFDKTAKDFLIPKGLYCLCLFGVAAPDLLQKDDFKIEQEGKKITILFEHRGNKYKIESDENGEIAVPDHFWILLQKKDSEEKNGENQTQAENPAPKTDDEKLPPEQENSPENPNDFVADIPPETIKTIFKGKLKANFDENGIFTLKGKLKLEENVKPEEPKEENNI